ncbi:MAG: tRNA (5-methylaminomethyl-2-thiouridine)(34)-methyltransferase MnmD, partial [Limnobacter sp.]|nr:tRNA (5-methylaminomethyl-2-thiouridine)(34)-methyltransferase MnmD [Limnobacter sp.]
MTAPARTGDADSRRPVGEAPAGIEGFGPHPGLVFDEAGAPYDAQHGDVFRNRNGAWEEAETVFVGGCRLRERWRECEHFTVFELGFGLGVNFLASLRAWRADPARCAALHFVSVESRPLSREDLRWGLESLGGLATDDAEALLAGWPPALPGLHRLAFAGGAVTLTLAFGDAPRIVPRLVLAADAIFLDGFAPSRNPRMWAPALLRAVARLARPGARLATWSTAASLRDALSALGFETTRMPGVRGKRHRLEAVRTAGSGPRSGAAPLSSAAPAPGDRRVLVVGAGLAGSAVAEGFARRGFEVVLLDARATPGGEGSAQPVCADHLHLSPDDNLLARLSRAALLLRSAHGEPVARGRLVVDADADAGRRSEAMLSRLGFPESFARHLHSDEASDVAGIRIPHGALWLPACAAIAPEPAIRAALAGGASGAIRFVGNAAVARLERDPAGRGWVLRNAAGERLADAPIVVLANAGDAPRLAGLASLPLHRTRGQSTWLREPALAGLRTVLGGAAYASPSGTGDGRLLVGASFGNGASPLPDPDDDAGNLQR